MNRKPLTPVVTDGTCARASSRRCRSAFTLIELLVVISIIAILTALLAASVFTALSRGNEVRNRNDISQLQNAVASFCDEYSVEYIPSRIHLCENLAAYNMNNQLDQDSFLYLRKLWPRLNTGSMVDWDGSGVAGDADYTLEGNECLVFFVGGIPSQIGLGTTGFGTDPVNPTTPGGERKRYFEFKSERLIATKGRYMSYRDVYGKMPFAYFSAYQQTNGYNRYGGTDCWTFGANPYFEPQAAANAPINYYKPSSFQIISAGVDGQFGPGGAWLPAQANQILKPGRDDMTNFYDKKLGTIGK